MARYPEEYSTKRHANMEGGEPQDSTPKKRTTGNYRTLRVGETVFLMPLTGYPAHQLVTREIISTQVTLSGSSRLYLYIIIAKKKRPLI